MGTCPMCRHDLFGGAIHMGSRHAIGNTVTQLLEQRRQLEEMRAASARRAASRAQVRARIQARQAEARQAQGRQVSKTELNMQSGLYSEQARVQMEALAAAGLQRNLSRASEGRVAPAANGVVLRYLSPGTLMMSEIRMREFRMRCRWG
jgi:hypothetical protein